MASHYKQIPLDEATPGMVLSDDLLDTHGNILLKGGLALSESTLAALQRHRIVMISIECNTEVSAVDEEAARAQLEIRLDTLFRKPGDDAEDATGLLEQHVRHFRLGDTQ